MTGIYTITCIPNGKVYVGRGQHIEGRRDCHFRALLLGTHNNIKLQNAHNKYGRDNLIFELLVECDKKFLISEEHYWATILMAHSNKYGMNIRPTHPYKSDAHLSIESRNKIKIANTGNRHTPEMRLHMSVIKLGKPPHPNTLKALRNIETKYKFTEANRISASEWHKKPVIQIDLNNNIVGEYESVKEAEEKTGFKYQGIASCCNGQRKNGIAYGYIWKFKNKIAI